MPKSWVPLSKLQLKKLRKARKESQSYDSYVAPVQKWGTYVPVAQRDLNIPAQRRVTDELPEFDDLPSFKRAKRSENDEEPKLKRKVVVGKTSEQRRDARRAVDGDMYLGYRGEGRVVDVE